VPAHTHRPFPLAWRIAIPASFVVWIAVSWGLSELNEHFGIGPYAWVQRRGPTGELVMLIIFYALMFGSPIALYAIGVRRFRIRPGTCERCGYDLTLPGSHARTRRLNTCPEYGWRAPLERHYGPV